MIRHASAQKQARQAEKRRLQNRTNLSKMKTAIKNVQDEQDKTKAAEVLKKNYKAFRQISC